MKTLTEIIDYTESIDEYFFRQGIKEGVLISFYESCNPNRQKLEGIVKYKYQLGFITVIDGKQYELRKLIDISIL